MIGVTMANTTGLVALVESEIRDAPSSAREVAKELGVPVKRVRRAIKFLMLGGRVRPLSKLRETKKCGAASTVYVYVPLKDRKRVMIRNGRILRRGGTLSGALPVRDYQGCVEPPEMISE